MNDDERCRAALKSLGDTVDTAELPSPESVRTRAWGGGVTSISSDEDAADDSIPMPSRGGQSVASD